MDWDTFIKYSHDAPHKVKGLLITFTWTGDSKVKGILTDLIYGPTKSWIRFELTIAGRIKYTVSSSSGESFHFHSDKERMLFKLENNL